MTGSDHGLVVHLTSVHNPTDVRIFFKECRTLARAGYEVRLIAKAEREEVRDGVRFIPLKPPRGRLDRFTITLFRTLVLALRQRADVYHFHDPELIPVGMTLKLFGRRVIYDVHEGYADSIMDRDWIPRWLRAPLARLVNVFESFAERMFDGVIAATPHIADSFKSGRVYVVRNFPMLGELMNPAPEPFGNRPPHIAFVGYISRGRGATQMVGAMGLLENDQIRLQLGCPFDDPGLEQQLKAMPGWSRVVHHGFMKRQDIAELYAGVIGGIVVFQPTGNYFWALPTKMFEYMSAGLPAIVSDFPILREIIERYRCGIVVDPRDPVAIARAMDWLAANREEAARMGERGYQAVLGEFNWEHEAEQLLACYGKVLSRR